MIVVTAAICRNEQGEYLLCQRGPGGSCAFLWEFPGGKQEAKETLTACLQRELKEELDVEAEIGALYAKVEYETADRVIELYFFETRLLGEPKPLVHETLRWVRQQAFAGYCFCPADAEILPHLGQAETK